MSRFVLRGAGPVPSFPDPQADLWDQVDRADPIDRAAETKPSLVFALSQ